MDAPGATTANGGADRETLEHSASTTCSQSPSDAHPDEQDRRHQGNDAVSEDAEDDQHSDDNENESDNEDEEPRLKYAYLTKHLGPVYRNGDATSTFLVAGDKMVCESHRSTLYSRLMNL